MNIRVTKDTLLSFKPSATTFMVHQVNNRAIANQKSYGKVNGNTVNAIVPACVPNVTSQTPLSSFGKLAECYAFCIREAVKSGAELILVYPLGVGIEKKIVEEDANGSEIWGDLFWNHSKSSRAAKLAVEAITTLEDTPDSVVVEFVVPEKAFDDWDTAMRFS